MGDDDGLVCAYINAQDGKWQEISWGDIRKWQRGDGLLWIHLDRAAERAKSWLQNESGLDPLISENHRQHVA
jgi:zinc transporter